MAIEEKVQKLLLTLFFIFYIFIDMSSPFKYIISKDFLIQRYKKERLSCLTISKEIGCSCCVISNRLKFFNIKTRKGSETQIGKPKWQDKPHPKGMLNKNHTNEAKLKMKKSSPHLCGKNHPQWKGGITTLYQQLWNSWQYKEWRKEVYVRDNYTCRDCGERNSKGKFLKLNAHHIIGTKKIIQENKAKNINDILNCEKIFKVENGLTLCIKCHLKTKNYGWKVRDIQYG